eukprot:TRINITY_DN45670_c0_g1_i2.p1 TRINITY_DN45670_c0_g1~~TRINITY_DN45670_c0_g1_i2.p1  ORF type:complete len:127 (-),score=13.48 TRINITY_DN45670_c0_g1_i2:10-351(-)
MDTSNTWSYNKNPHQGIYALFRFEIATEITLQIAQGDGGAARPILSHSGTKLAFITRNIFKTSLVLHDLTTGNDLIIYDGLSHDMQACSSPHGKIGRAVQQECRDRSRMPSSA